MNRLILLIALAVPPAYSQSPAAPPPSNVNQPGAPAPAPTTTGSTSSRISRVISGPDGRAQGLLLRNGTFVNLSHDLSQQIPAGVSRRALVNVSGPVYGVGSDRTIEAQQITIAGIAYNDVQGAGAGPAGQPPPNGALAPPPPPGGPGAPTPSPPPPP